MCLYPTLIKNKKYVANKKNKGIIPTAKDERVLYVPVGCQKCMECRKDKARQWNVRLLEDIRENKRAYFVTLTFSNESIKELSEKINTELDGYDRDNAIAKKGVRYFLERWRKKHKKSVRHWLVTELGHNGTENIHLHGIIWTDKNPKEITERWEYGYVWIGEYANEKTINYITKYITKTDLKHKEYKSLILTSSGIGSNYINRADSKNNKYKGTDTKEYYKSRNGFKLKLPIYWRNKIYSEEEREKLWLHKLDEQVRYVDGQKIDISKGDKTYYQYLEIARRKNKMLGYGTAIVTGKQIGSTRLNSSHRL